MKRYITFGGTNKLGGWKDYLGNASTIAEACALPWIVKMPIMWWHVVDTQTGKIVQDGSGKIIGNDNI